MRSATNGKHQESMINLSMRLVLCGYHKPLLCLYIGLSPKPMKARRIRILAAQCWWCCCFCEIPSKQLIAIGGQLAKIVYHDILLLIYKFKFKTVELQLCASCLLILCLYITFILYYHEYITSRVVFIQS